MEDISFDINGILSEEEAVQLFEQQEHNDAPADNGNNEDNNPAEETEENNTQTPEKVGDGDSENAEDAVHEQGDGSSPSIYSSIADALRKDDIFPDFTDEEIEAIKTPEDFAELFRKAIKAGEDERVSRVNEALENGVKPDTVKMYEDTIQYLDSVSEESVSEEGEKGEDLRKQLIYNDLMNRGYSHEKALKEVEKSFKSGSDIEDATEALEALKKFYKDGYTKIQNDAKKHTEEIKAQQKKQSEDFRKLILEDEIKLGDTVLDKRTCQKVFDAVSKPVYKDEASGRLLTEVQKFQKEHPLEFLKQLGMWYVLTEGGKNVSGFTSKQVRAEKNKHIEELGRKINSTSLTREGSLRYVGGSSGDSDPLLSDGWKVGW